MTKIAVFAAMAMSAMSFALPATAQSNGQIVATPIVSSQGAAGNYMTTADGCTYRRTQAPGFAPAWILVLNPHHIGRPNSPRHCSGMLK